MVTSIRSSLYSQEPYHRHKPDLTTPLGLDSIWDTIASRTPPNPDKRLKYQSPSTRPVSRGRKDSLKLRASLASLVASSRLCSLKARVNRLRLFREASLCRSRRHSLLPDTGRRPFCHRILSLLGYAGAVGRGLA
jgi:hypothetical protein